jgi:hypothetical protein
MKGSLIAVVALLRFERTSLFWSLNSRDLSTIASALPAAVPSKFAVQITADLGNGTTIQYLGKDRKGGAVSSIADAAPCSIARRDYLSCDGRTMGASSNRAYTAGPIPPVAPLVATGDPGATIDGYSVDESYVLHWKSDKFPESIMKSKAEGGQAGEAIFGLAKATDGPIKVVQLLGLKNATFTGYDKIAAGTAKVVPV